MDEDEPTHLTASDPTPTDIGQIRLPDLSPKLETVSEDASVSDPPDEIHKGPRPPIHLGEEIAKAAASPMLTPPVTGPEKIQADATLSLHTGIPDSCDEDSVATVPDVVPPSSVIPEPALSVSQTPKRSMSRTRSRSRSRSPSPTLLSSPLTCFSSSPMREEEARQSSPESDSTDVETTCKPTKTPAKRRSIGGVDVRASKKFRVEATPTDSVADTEVEEQPASKTRRNTGKKSARSSSPSPCPDPSLVSTDVIATSDAADSEPTDQSIMGMVVEALAMTRASSMDVESIRKVVVVCPASLFHFVALSI
jgi:hypothetical protein